MGRFSCKTPKQLITFLNVTNEMNYCLTIDNLHLNKKHHIYKTVGLDRNDINGKKYVLNF